MKKSLIFLLLASALALTGAYVSQYFFDYQPCILCYYQRIPFFVVIGLTILALTFFSSQKFAKIIFITCLAALIANVAIASYNVGVEKKIFSGPTTCSDKKLDEAQNLEELIATISATKRR
jgi:disulfide bond formation protein DsbB